MKQLSLLPKLCLLGAMLLLLSFTWGADDPVDKLVAALQRWTASQPQEKVYLHMDKPYYALGDTIWFKGYVTIGSRHQLSALSGALYVELINERDSVLKTLKLPITSGMVMGDFTLSDDYPEGSYRVRAYTQWMRNAGPAYYFDRTFAVGNPVSHTLVTKAGYRYSLNTANNKQVLTATLNYSDDHGQPLAGRSVDYQVVINKRVAWTATVKTDTHGDIPVTIPKDGNTRLDGAYIHTTITGDDKEKVTRDFPVKAAPAPADIQFFPEGGGLVTGLSSRIGFKATGTDGLGIAVKGTVTDNDNKEITTIASQHAGMGSFTLKPEAGKTYSAKLTLADGTTQTLALPGAAAEGYTLSVYQPNKDSVLVRVSASAGKLYQTVSLVAQTGGEVVFAGALKLTGNQTSVWLQKKAFPTGIAQFTLFDSKGEPQNERVAFIRGNDLMQLNIKTAKSSYQSKEHISLELAATDSKGKGVAGNFSVAVIDESRVPSEESAEHTIYSDLLLSSDIKGYIEKPNYYFTAGTDEVNRALDNLLLTQGYRRFSWKALTDTTTTANKPAFAAEGLGAQISGRVETLGHKPLPNATVMLMALKAGVMKTMKTDANGRFNFDKMFLTDSVKFSVQARTAKNSDKVKVILDTIAKQQTGHNPNAGDVSTDINATLQTYIDNGKKLDDFYEKTGQLDKVHRLKQVVIRARKAASPYNNQGMYQIPEGQSDQTLIGLDPKYTNIGNALTQLLHGVFFKEYGDVMNYPYVHVPLGGYVPLQLILDGRKVDADEAASILDGGAVDVEGVAKIEMVKNGGAMMSMLGGPALLIYTKAGYIHKDYNPAMVSIMPKGFNKAREFYSPRYKAGSGAGQQPDARTTIYWNPYLKTDTTGKAAFNYFNADGPGTYKVIVEGLNAAGELGRQVYRYTVTEGQKSASAAGPVLDRNAAITTPLDSLHKRLPIEKAYLHTDKPYYNIGDTLWFKAYLTDANLNSSKLSGLLYVELDNDSSEMVRRISIPIKAGLGWGQIPLTPKIFRQGGYTLRAYTNWMQNFGEDYVFSQRFYLGVPAGDAWLVKSAATIGHLADKDQLQVNLQLKKGNQLPLGLHKVEVRIYDDWHYLYKEELTTGIDGSLKLSQALKTKTDGRRLRVQLTGLEKGDGDKVVQVPLSINRNQNIDLQFLPEGGNLVTGLQSTVGFKAIGEDGKGTPVLGGIYDSKGTEVTGFAAIHNGMGSFEFTPKAGETYSARISKPTVKSFELPKISPTGTVLHITNPENKEELTVSINSSINTNSKLTADSLYLIGMAKGNILYSKKLNNASGVNLTISKNLFPTGIARFTLFSGRTPLNERRVFIDQHDGLNIKVVPNKATYLKRDSVSLSIEVKDKGGVPVRGSFSLSVTDDSQVRADSLGDHSIAANLLLNSEIRGAIESPGYYINRTDKQAWQALDNLMLTQGWTGYDWKDVFEPKPKPVAFKPEKDFKITGRVTNLAKNPIAGAQVLISSKKPSFLTTITANEQGEFTIKNLPQIDSGSFFFQAKKANGKKMTFGNVSINKFKSPVIPETLRSPVMPWYVNTDSTQLNYVKRKAQLADEANLKLTGNVLKQVNIKAIKPTKNKYLRVVPDVVYDEQDIKESATITLYELLQQKLPGVKIVTIHNLPTLISNHSFVRVEIDGWPLPVHMYAGATEDDLLEELHSFKIATVKEMAVRYARPVTIAIESIVTIMAEFKLKSEGSVTYLNARASIGYRDYGTTYIGIVSGNDRGWYKNQAPDVVTYRPLPIMYPQQFYSPKYRIKPPAIIEPDYRSTIFWEPDITTDENGRAKVSFSTSDINGKYTIKVAGATADGEIGDGSFKMQVK